MNNISIQVASAANACYAYYVGKNLSSDVMNKIVALVAESGESEFSEDYLAYKAEYDARVLSEETTDNN